MGWKRQNDLAKEVEKRQKRRKKRCKTVKDTGEKRREKLGRKE